MRKILILGGFTLLLVVGSLLCHAIALEPQTILSRKDPARVEYERFLERFDSRRYGYVIVNHPVNADVLSISEDISDFLSKSPAVARVVSPQNARFFLGSEYFSFSSLF